MSAKFSLEIESKSFDFDIDNIEFSYHIKDKKKFLSKKRFHHEEGSHIPTRKKFEEIMEESIFRNSEEKDAFLTVFPMGLKPNIPSEDEVSFEDDKRYFIKKKKEQRITLKAYYPGNYLFTKSEKDLLKEYLKGFDFSKVTRSAKKQEKFKHKHYIRRNIKTPFLNTYLLNALNNKLKKAGFEPRFIKFPHSFTINVAKSFNKTLMNMRLIEIFRTEKLFEEQKNKKDSQKLKDKKKMTDMKNKEIYVHNKAVADLIVNDGNPELNMILNRKLHLLFEEYLNSKEFGVDEIDKLKKSKKKNEDYFIAKCVYLAIHFIEFCSQ
jgi:hypothetical protein